MKTERDSAELDELLSGGHLSGPQYEIILDRVLNRAEPKKSKAPLIWSLAALTVAGSCFALLVHLNADVQPRLRARGSDELPLKGAVDARCTAGETRNQAFICRTGDVLALSVNTSLVSGHVSARATPLSGGPPIWYFPTSGAGSPEVSPATGTQAVTEGVRIGKEHRPGAYLLDVWVTTEAVPFADVARLDGMPHATLRFQVEP